MQNFNEIYQNVVKESKNELEELRQKIYKKVVLYLIVAFVCLIIKFYIGTIIAIFMAVGICGNR